MPTKITRLLTLLVAFICVPACLSAQHPLSKKLEAFAEAEATVNNYSGTILVVKNDTVLLKKAYGYGDREWEAKNTPDTKFSLASITKTFTALAVLQLAERKQLSLDDKLSKYFPAYPKGDSITLHMMLVHTAGLPLDFDELYVNQATVSPDSALAYIMKLPYAFSPGRQVGYSNIGYYLLARIIGQVSGQTYSQYMHQHVFAVAGMPNTGVNNNDTVLLKRARLYYDREGIVAHDPFLNWELNRGHDGIFSTVEDLYQFSKALQGTRLLSEESKRLMFTRHNENRLQDNFFQSHGYGVMVNPFFNLGHNLLTYSGGFMAAVSSICIYPNDGLFVAALSNNGSMANDLTYSLSASVFGRDVAMPYKPVPVSATVSLYPSYSGTYGRFQIEPRDNKLYIKSPNTELIPESDRKFFYASNPSRKIEFVVDKKGKPVALNYIKGGVTERLEKEKVGKLKR